jgi:AbrB family looped-hinge helix DNA binding protein
MRITAKGQVTIPREIRERADLLPGTDVVFTLEADGGVRLVKAGPGARRAVRSWSPICSSTSSRRAAAAAAS